MSSRSSLLFALMIGLCLAVTSVMSAALMAPDRMSQSRMVYAMIVGAELTDFCGDHGDHTTHDHPCPFCHGLPEAPVACAPDMTMAFRPSDLWRQSEGLRRAAQARNINHSSRAPPRIV